MCGFKAVSERQLCLMIKVARVKKVILHPNPEPLLRCAVGGFVDSEAQV